MSTFFVRLTPGCHLLIDNQIVYEQYDETKVYAVNAQMQRLLILTVPIF